MSDTETTEPTPDEVNQAIRPETLIQRLEALEAKVFPKAQTNTAPDPAPQAPITGTLGVR